MRLRVIDWNLDGFTGIDAKLQLLDGLPWDICLLQEVTTASWPRLRELGDQACWSGDHLPPLATEPRYRSAVVVRGGWQLTDRDEVAVVGQRTQRDLVSPSAIRAAAGDALDQILPGRGPCSRAS